MSVHVEVDGADQLARTLAAVADQLGDLSDLHHTLGDIIVAAAGPLTPVRTGALLAATTAIAGPTETTIINAQDYAAAVHARRPFLESAATGTEAQQLAAANAYLQGLLNTVKGA